MAKKSYMSPVMEQYAMQHVQLLDGSGNAGAGINDDYSAGSDNTTDESQPTGW